MEKNFVVSGFTRVCEKILDFIILGVNFSRTHKLGKFCKILQIIIAFTLHGLVTVWLWEKADMGEILASFYAFSGLIVLVLLSRDAFDFDDSSILSFLLKITAIMWGLGIATCFIFDIGIKHDYIAMLFVGVAETLALVLCYKAVVHPLIKFFSKNKEDRLQQWKNFLQHCLSLLKFFAAILVIAALIYFGKKFLW